MAHDLQEIVMPPLVTFRVTLTTPAALGFLRQGMVKLCRDNFGMETSTTEGEPFVRNLTIKVPSVHAIQVFTYLYHCMEVGGYVRLLQMEPIVGTQQIDTLPDPETDVWLEPLAGPKVHIGVFYRDTQDVLWHEEVMVLPDSQKDAIHGFLRHLLEQDRLQINEVFRQRRASSGIAYVDIPVNQLLRRGN